MLISRAKRESLFPSAKTAAETNVAAAAIMIVLYVPAKAAVKSAESHPIDAKASFDFSFSGEGRSFMAVTPFGLFCSSAV